MVTSSVTILDNRTGKTSDLPVVNGAMDLRQFRTGSEDFGQLSYDPAFEIGKREEGAGRP